MKRSGFMASAKVKADLTFFGPPNGNGLKQKLNVRW